MGRFDGGAEFIDSGVIDFELAVEIREMISGLGGYGSFEDDAMECIERVAADNIAERKNKAKEWRPSFLRVEGKTHISMHKGVWDWENRTVRPTRRNSALCHQWVEGRNREIDLIKRLDSLHSSDFGAIIAAAALTPMPYRG